MDFRITATRTSVNAWAKGSAQTLLEAQLSEDVTVLEEGDRGLLVVAVDLVEPYRTGQEVKMFVGVTRGEDASWPHSVARPPECPLLEIFEGERG